MRISDWSSDVCSSDLNDEGDGGREARGECRVGGQRIEAAVSGQRRLSISQKAMATAAPMPVPISNPAEDWPIAAPIRAPAMMARARTEPAARGGRGGGDRDMARAFAPASR